MPVTPTVVTSIPQPANTPEGFLFFFDDCPFVRATSGFYTWAVAPAEPGTGRSRVQIETCALFHLICPRSSFGKQPADQAAASRRTPLSLRFADAFWGRLVTQLDESGLFVDDFTDCEVFADALRDLVLTDAGDLVIVAADWRATEAYNVPALNNQHRPAFDRINFLSRTYVTTLEDEDIKTPLAPLCRLVGAVGPVLNQQSRREHNLFLSNLLFVVERLTSEAKNDTEKAHMLPELLSNAILPSPLLSANLSLRSINQDLSLALQYGNAETSQGKAKIERKRANTISIRRPLPPHPHPPRFRPVARPRRAPVPTSLPARPTTRRPEGTAERLRA